jgi:hypothetical protein
MTFLPGDHQVAEGVLHIDRDVAWCEYEVIVELDFVVTKMSDLHGNAIDHEAQSGYIELTKTPPDIYITPDCTIVWEACTTFTVDVMVSHVVRMKSYEVLIYWPEWLNLEDIDIHTGFLPEPFEDVYILIEDEAGGPHYLQVEVKSFCKFEPVSATLGKIMTLTFHVKGPWGQLAENPYLNWMVALPGFHWRAPLYHFDGNACRGWLPQNATGEIAFDWAVYDIWNSTCGEYVWFEIVEDATVQFRPVPGDLTLDGVVNLDDVAPAIGLYGMDTSGLNWILGGPFNVPPWTYSMCGNYVPGDFNADGVIDIFDAVIVARYIFLEEPDLTLGCDGPDGPC